MRHNLANLRGAVYLHNFLLSGLLLLVGCASQRTPDVTSDSACDELSTAERDRSFALLHPSGSTPALSTTTTHPQLQRPSAAFRPLAASARTPNISVLMYHDVLPQKQVWFDDTVAVFKSQMKEIHDRGFRVISARELWKHLVDGTPAPPHSIVLTFDDASEGQYLYVIPVLKQYHYPATFFVHTGYVGLTTGKQHMTWDQLREAEATGLVDVEGRTVTHPCNMPDLSKEELQKELQGGAAAVQEHLGHGSLFFSYPCGHYNAKAEDAVRAAGYVMAFDEDRGFANRSPSILAVNRFTPRRFEEALKFR